jgi:hypothetical protein
VNLEAEVERQRARAEELEARVTDLLVRIADDKSAMQPLAKIAITHLERASGLEAALLDLDVPLAQLRHLYAQMVGGLVRDATEAARGLLGPSIERIEQARAALRGEPAIGTPVEDVIAAIDQMEPYTVAFVPIDRAPFPLVDPKADARLIAAAPDLLAVLRAIVNSDATAAVPCDGPGCPFCTLIEQARAALAKVEGT